MAAVRARAAGLPEPALAPADLDAMRTHRARLVEATRSADAGERALAIERFILSMWRAGFAPQTMRALVSAAVDAGIAWRRGQVHTLARLRTIDASRQCAEAIITRLERRRDVR